MRRLAGWEQRLADVVTEFQGRPYALGESDCLRFACAAHQAVYGVDHWPHWRGRYSSRREALKLLADRRSTLADMVGGLGGLVPRRTAGVAMRGDIAVLRDGDIHLGVVVDHRIAVYAEQGVDMVPADDPRVLMIMTADDA